MVTLERNLTNAKASKASMKMREPPSPTPNQTQAK
jgi:hypothetical protein